jgi:hypothetical protein
VLGGLLVLAVIIVASPNFESVRSYFAAFFVAIFLCAYPSLSSGRVAYAGLQAGVSFVLTYVRQPRRPTSMIHYGGCGASSWASLLSVACSCWSAPEYASKALWARLQAILQGALRLLRPTDDLNEQRLQEINLDAALQLTRLIALLKMRAWRGGTAVSIRTVWSRSRACCGASCIG